jgi:nucleoside-diphosphate-sugar epimerase
VGKLYLVTGGAGFIGSTLVRRLLQDGHGVRVLDNQSRGRAARLADVRDHVEFIDADVRDADAVRKAAKAVDSLCHLASVNGTEWFYSRPEIVLDVGVKGIVNTIDACLEHGVPEFVLASSSEVYQTPPAIPTDEAAPLTVPDPLNPRYSYGGGKIISELMALNYGRSHLERVLVVRPHNVYGPDMGREHVIPQFVLRADELTREHPDGVVPFPIQGDGTQTRAFVHIDDFTDGLATVLEKGAHLNIYHVGNDNEVTVRRLVELIFDHLGRNCEIIPGALTQGSTRRRCPNIDKLRALGYSPSISLREGLPKVIDWYLENRP